MGDSLLEALTLDGDAEVRHGQDRSTNGLRSAPCRADLGDSPLAAGGPLRHRAPDPHQRNQESDGQGAHDDESRDGGVSHARE